MTTDNRTYQTNFYEMIRTYPSINLLLQNIGVTYNISVYATKSGYDNSETANYVHRYLIWLLCNRSRPRIMG